MVVFSLLEKYKKEQFVLLTTTNITKKKLFRVVNKSDFACAICNESGRIVFFND